MPDRRKRRLLALVNHPRVYLQLPRQLLIFNNGILMKRRIFFLAQQTQASKYMEHPTTRVFKQIQSCCDRAVKTSKQGVQRIRELPHYCMGSVEN